MNRDEKALRLLQGLQPVMDGARDADKRCCEEIERLSTQELRVLCAVAEEKCCVMSGLAKAIRLSLSSVTGLVDRLVEKRLVRRDRSPEDRRVVEVALTDEGELLGKEALKRRLAYARELLDALEPAEQESFLALLEKMKAKSAR